MTYVVNQDCFDFVKSLQDQEVDLVLMDPPYFNIVKEHWDNQWKTVDDYVQWMFDLFMALKPKMKPQSSLVFFGGIGKHNERPLFKLMDKVESINLFQYRNMITWSKKRGFGKSKDYLFCREEIVWYSMSSVRTEVTFNIPLLDTKRGYSGFLKKYPAKSEFKRRTNVWSDISEIFKPTRPTQKPAPLMDVLVKTHSNPGDLVVDCFSGTGATGESALRLGRMFKGCEKILVDATSANQVCVTAAAKLLIPKP